MDLASWYQPELQLSGCCLKGLPKLGRAGLRTEPAAWADADVGFRVDARRLRLGLGYPPPSLRAGLIGCRQHSLSEGEPRGFLAVTGVGMTQ